jgi:hypothetical protein
MFRVPGSIIRHGIQVMLIPLEECVSEAMVEGLGTTFELGPAYCCPEVWKCCSLAAAHTHTQIATRTNGTVQVPSVHVTKQFFLHYESRPGNVYPHQRVNDQNLISVSEKMVLKYIHV